MTVPVLFGLDIKQAVSTHVVNAQGLTCSCSQVRHPHRICHCFLGISGTVLSVKTAMLTTIGLIINTNGALMQLNTACVVLHEQHVMSAWCAKTDPAVSHIRLIPGEYVVLLLLLLVVLSSLR